MCAGALGLKQSLSAAHTLDLHSTGVFQAGARAPFCWDLPGAFGHGGRTLVRGPEASEVPGEGRDENMIWRLLFSVEVQSSFFAVNSYWLVISPCRQGLFFCIWK